MFGATTWPSLRYQHYQHAINKAAGEAVAPGIEEDQL
jgi:hypothetical protein